MNADAHRLTRPSQWPLAWRMGAVFWLLAFVPALCAMLYTFSESQASYSELQAEALQDSAARIAGRLSQLIGDEARVNAFLAMDPELAGLLSSRSRSAERGLPTLHRMIVANRDVELIMVLDENGDVVTSTDPDLVGRNFAFRDYFKLAIQGRPHVTGLIVGAVAGNAGAYFSHPVTTGSGKVVGAFVTKITAKAFVSVVENERRSKAHTAFLVDSDGVVTYHPNPEWMYRSIVPLSEKAQANILADRRFRLPRIESLDVASLQEAVSTYRAAGSVRWLSAATGRHERAGYAFVPVHNWAVIVSSEERQLALARLGLERIVMATVAAVTVAFVAAFLLLALLTIKPLRRMNAAARRILDGEYRDTQAGAAAGELGRIAGALDVAAAGLLSHEREREVQGRVLLPEIRATLTTGRPDGGTLPRMAVVYCALAGVNEMFDRRSSSEVLATLSDYGEQISEIVRPWGGRVNNIGGGSIVAVFAAPLTDDKLESHALSAALAVQHRVSEFNRARGEENEPVLEVAIGVSATGILVTGAPGAHERHLNLMLHDGINVSSTLAALSMQSPQHPVMINHTTYIGVRNRADIALASLGPRKLRGRAELSEVYSVTFFSRAPLVPSGVVAIPAKAVPDRISVRPPS